MRHNVTSYVSKQGSHVLAASSPEQALAEAGGDVNPGRLATPPGPRGRSGRGEQPAEETASPRPFPVPCRAPSRTYLIVRLGRNPEKAPKDVPEGCPARCSGWLCRGLALRTGCPSHGEGCPPVHRPSERSAARLPGPRRAASPRHPQPRLAPVSSPHRAHEAVGSGRHRPRGLVPATAQFPGS